MDSNNNNIEDSHRSKKNITFLHIYVSFFVYGDGKLWHKLS